MKSIPKALLLVLSLAGTCLASEPTTGSSQQTEQEPEISTFRDRFSLRFLTNYNFISIQNSAYGNEPLESNRPLNLGIGFGYDSLFTLFDKSWDFSFDIRYNPPHHDNRRAHQRPRVRDGNQLFPGRLVAFGKLSLLQRLHDKNP